MYDLAVIGAGPYGLSIAAHAVESGLTTRVFGRVMASWRDHMPDGMFLKSEPWSSNLSDPHGRHDLSSYCAGLGVESGHGKPVPVETYRDYGMWFARQSVPEVEDQQVTRLRPRGDDWELTTAQGETVVARSVALAVGMMPFVEIPEVLRGLPSTWVSHSSHHRSLSRFRDREVMVVGAGQAALETAALVAEEGARVRIVARGEAIRWNTPPQPLERGLLRALRDPHCGLGTGWPSWVWSETPWAVRRLPARAREHIADRALGPAGAWWLRERVEGVVPVELGCHLSSAIPHGERLRVRGLGANGAERHWEVDHVIAATGFTADLDRVAMLDPGVRDTLRRSGTGAAPELGRFFETSHPGLFCAGLLTVPTFGPAMRFVYGASFTARRLVAGVRRRGGGRFTARVPRPVPGARAAGQASTRRTASSR